MTDDERPDGELGDELEEVPAGEATDADDAYDADDELELEEGE